MLTGISLFLVYFIRIQLSKVFLDGDTWVAQSTQFIIGGFDTISSVITLALYELSKNHDIQERVRNEIKNCTGDPNNLPYGNLNDMHYLNMVLNETLRKYPAFPFVDRMCIKDYNLPGTKVIIPKGNAVCVSLLGLHYDPKNFPDPQKFDPERFSKDNSSARSNVFLPFSMGPRTCIGERLARITLKVALIKIISKFNIELAEHKTPKFSTKTLAIVLEEDLKLIFTEIKS